MAFESNLVTFLLAAETLSGLVGERIHPTKKPPAALKPITYPCITFFKVSAPRDHTLDGVGGMVFARFQFNCWGKTYKETRSVADALRVALDNFRGEMGDSRVHAALLQDETDVLDAGLAVDADTIHGVRQDYRILYTE